MAILLRHVNEPIPPRASVDPTVDPRLSDWIERLLAKDAGGPPAARPPPGTRSRRSCSTGSGRAGAGRRAWLRVSGGASRRPPRGRWRVATRRTRG